MRRTSFGLATRLSVALAAAFFALAPAADTDSPPRFELVQPELFEATGGQPNAWADFDNARQSLAIDVVDAHNRHTKLALRCVSTLPGPAA